MERGRFRAVARHEGGGEAGGDGHGLARIIDEGQPHLALGGDEKLGVGFQFGQDATLVGAGDFRGVGVAGVVVAVGGKDGRGTGEDEGEDTSSDR